MKAKYNRLKKFEILKRIKQTTRFFREFPGTGTQKMQYSLSIFQNLLEKYFPEYDEGMVAVG